MFEPYPPPSSQRRSIPIAVTLALHMVLLALWHMSRSASAPSPHAQYEPYELRLIALKPPRPQPAAAAPSKAPPRPSTAAPRAPVMAPQSITKLAITPPAPPAEPATFAAPRAPTPSADAIMQQARRDVGKIDRDLRKAYPGGPIKAPGDSPQIRLEKGIELAHDMAPPGLFEAPKVKEIIDPGQYGRRRYRVITALGTYCLTHESNRGNDGQDVFTANRLPKKSNCPPDEQPATQQKW